MNTVVIVGLGLCACAAPRSTPRAPVQRVEDPKDADDVASLKAEVASMKAQIATLENRVGHLVSEVSAASADDELSQMSIDKVHWADKQSPFNQMMGGHTYLLAHVVEWRGYGKMLRFTRTADPVFYMEAEGHPAITAHVLTGGVCNDDGSVREVMIQPDSAPLAGATYHLRARNEKDAYRWTVSPGLAVVAR